MALDTSQRAPSEVGGAQRALGLFMVRLHGNHKAFGGVGADLSSGTADQRHHLFTASDADARRRPRMGGTIVGDVLCPLATADVLLAAELREHLHPTEKRRGRLDKGGGSIEGIRRDTGNPDVSMVGLEVFKPAPGEVVFGGIRGLGGRFGRALGLGGLLLLARFCAPIPGTECRSRLLEDTAHGQGDWRRHQEEEDQTLAPERAPTCFVAQFLERGELLGRFGPRVIRVVDNQAAGGEAMVAQEHPHTGDQEAVPRNFARAKPPGQSRHRVSPEARAFQSGPAHGGGNERGGDTKGQPGALHGAQAGVGGLLAKGLINGIDKGAHTGGRFSNNHRRLQAISARQAQWA